jgi:hypothetical protein
MLPWMMQSPLFPHIAMLMSSVTQSLEQRFTSDTNPEEPLMIKANVLALINKSLTEQDFAAVAVDVMRCVTNLTITEVSWAGVPRL